MVVGGGYLDYRVSSGPFLRFSLRFEFLSETIETRDPSLTIDSFIFLRLPLTVIDLLLGVF